MSERYTPSTERLRVDPIAAALVNAAKTAQEAADFYAAQLDEMRTKAIQVAEAQTAPIVVQTYGRATGKREIDRLSAIEQAARVLEAGLDAQDLPAERREALLRLRVALARET